eukprot:7381940-Prymnesium_polylepis.3
MGHRPEAARGRYASARCESLLLGIEFMVLCDALEVEQSVNLPRTHTPAVGAPAHTDLRSHGPKATTRRPSRRLKCFESRDLCRDVWVGRVSLRQGETDERSGGSGGAIESARTQ